MSTKSQALFIFFLCLLHFSFQTEQCKPIPTPFLLPSTDVPYNITENFLVIEVDPSTGARCLDGSNYKFLFSPGAGPGANKFVIEFDGGGFCGVDGLDFFESCVQRSQAFMGSSNFLPSNGSWSQITDRLLGYLSNSKPHNPYFYNWNKIQIKYCDGSNHQGHKEDPYDINGTKLYFRGYKNVLAVLHYAKEHLGLFTAKEVLLAGSSAGAQAFLQWANYIRQTLPCSVKVSGLSDSGLFLDVYNRQDKCNFFLFANQKVAEYTDSVSLPLFEWCKYRDTEVWKCMMPEYVIMEINIPVFLANSQTDNSPLMTQVGVDCISMGYPCTDDQLNVILDYKARVMDIISKIRQLKPDWGYWIHGCYEHILITTWGWYGAQYNIGWDNNKNKTISYRAALTYWYNYGGEKKRDAHFIDPLDYRTNPKCPKPKPPSSNSLPPLPSNLPNGNLPPMNGNLPTINGNLPPVNGNLPPLTNLMNMRKGKI